VVFGGAGFPSQPQTAGTSLFTINKPKRKDKTAMITLECNYSKKLGLPGYSSHQFSITLRTEIADLTQVQVETAKLYKLLQEGVDSSIKEVGFLPTNGNGNGSNGHSNGNGNGSNGHSNNGNGQTPVNEQDRWNCSEKQKDLVLKIVTENNLDKKTVEQLAQERFGKGVRTLNKLECSALIEELLEQTGQNQGQGRGRFQGRFQQRTGAR
jgi:hypothetical protein